MAWKALCHDRPLIARAGAVAWSTALPITRKPSWCPPGGGSSFPQFEVLSAYALQTIDRVTRPPSSHLPMSSLPLNRPPPTKHCLLAWGVPEAIHPSAYNHGHFHPLTNLLVRLLATLPAYPSLTRVISTKAASLVGFHVGFLPGSTAERPLLRPINTAQTTRFFATTVKP